MWERRAPLNPGHVQNLVRDGVRVLVQPSTRRAYSMAEYEASGAVITDDFSQADAIMSVKQPPIESLIADKTYICFSHTIKAQRDNMPLLDAILEKRIRLVDYECIHDDRGVRLVAFGQYAGVAGMINILHGMGLRLLALGHHTPFMHVGAAHNYPSSSAAKSAIASLGREVQYGMMPKVLGPMVFTFTGAGNVSQGAQEVFKELPHEYVSVDQLPSVVEGGDMRKVYGVVVDKRDHLQRKDGGGYSDEDFAANPHDYTPLFPEKVAPYTSCLVNGVFWTPGTPRLLTKEQATSLHPATLDLGSIKSEGTPHLPQRLLAIADISCDFGGSLEFMEFGTTIDNPFLLYNAHTRTTNPNIGSNGIVMMCVDNLPAQIPREATDYFGTRLLPYIQDCLKLSGRKPLEECTEVRREITDALIAYNGRLTEKYSYIEQLRRQA